MSNEPTTGLPAIRRAWVPRAVAAAAVVVGLIDITRLLFPRVWRHLARLTDVLPAALTTTTVAVTAAVGVTLLFLASGLARRKRTAWSITVALLAVSTVLTILHGHELDLAVTSGALLALMVLARRQFYALPDPRSGRRTSLLLGLLISTVLVTSVALVTAAGLAADRVGETWRLRAQAAVAGLVGIPTYATRSNDPLATGLYWTLLGLGLLVVAVTLFLLLRSPRSSPLPSAEDDQRARLLIATHGEHDSLAYFALRNDKSLAWSPSGKAAIAYRVVGGVMLASGDPLGDVEAWPGAIEQFLQIADLHAWAVGVVGASETGARVWGREASLAALEFGDEAVVSIESFTLEGREMRNVRQMVNRVSKTGITFDIRRLREIDATERGGLVRLADEWRSGEVERGFSMALGRLGDARDEQCAIATARRDDQVLGLLVLVPWGQRGLSLDLMRRSPDSEPGITDYLVTKTLQAACDLGVDQVSLNFAVLRSAIERGERIGAGPVARSWRALLVFVSRWAQIDSLYRFNAKFRPEWTPRFVLYRRSAGFARVVLAYLSAEGFLFVRRRPVGHVDDERPWLDAAASEGDATGWGRRRQERSTRG